MPVTAPETALVRDLRGLARDLVNLYGGDLVSLNLYGPAVDLERSTKDGEVQVLVVLSEASLKALGKVQETMASWWKSHRVAPLFVGRHEFDRSLDVFPLEFLSMKQRYVCLHGEDTLAGMVIQKEHLRLQLEEDLKTKAFWLRQFYVRDGRHTRSLRKMLVDSFSGIAALFNGLLLLKDRTLLAQSDSLIGAMAEVYNLDPAPLQALLAVSQGSRSPGQEELIELAHAYDRVLNALIEAVDTLEAA